MTEVITIKFKSSNKSYYFSPNGKKVQAGDTVIVNSRDMLTPCRVIHGNHFVEDDHIIGDLKPIERVATEWDKRRIAENEELEKKAYEICGELIRKHELPMVLSNASYTFDRSKVYFHYTAPERVDFRALVKDLGRAFHTRVELCQIGNRDECKLFGGVGICGRVFCCNGFLHDFMTVQIKTAKLQKLPTNIQKLTGPCERLRCCLKYEESQYVEMAKEFPSVGEYVKTPEGKGTVIDTNYLSGNVRVHLDSDDPGKLNIVTVNNADIVRKDKN